MDKVQEIENRLNAHLEHLQSIKFALQNGEMINEELGKFVTEVDNTFWSLPDPQ